MRKFIFLGSLFAGFAVQAKEIHGKYFSLKGMTDFRTSWDEQGHQGRISSRFHWTNIDLATDTMGYGFWYARTKKLISPKLPAGCELQSDVNGAVSAVNPIFANTLEFRVFGLSCREALSLFEMQPIVMEFEDVPALDATKPALPFLRLVMDELPGTPIPLDTLKERYANLDSYKDERQGCASHWVPNDEINDMAAQLISRNSLSLEDVQVLGTRDYAYDFTSYVFPELLRCANEMTFSVTVSYRTPDLPSHCMFEGKVTKTRSYLSENRQYSKYSFEEWPSRVVCK